MGKENSKLETLLEGNPKSEIRNSKQIRMIKISNSKRFRTLKFLNFEIVSDFDIRISNFPAGVRGFTLLELIIVLAVISILLSVAIPTYQAIIRRAHESVMKENLYTMRRAIEAFAADQGRYPQSLQELVDREYLKEIPLDAITNSRETWQEIREEGTPLGQDGQPGIVDVKSGAEGQSTEGTAYSEW